MDTENLTLKTESHLSLKLLKMHSRDALPVEILSVFNPLVHREEKITAGKY